ncbi:MAG: hypothetical protein ACRCWQ_10490 [Bacilli bacterium]
MLKIFSPNYKKHQPPNFNKAKHIQNYYIEDHDTAIVYIKLNDIQDAYANFCIAGKEELSPELAAHLDSVIHHISLQYTVRLHFQIANGATEQQQILLSSVIFTYYGLYLEDKKQELKINTHKTYGLLFFGIIFLAFSYFLMKNEQGQIVTDIINIAGTFALWEAVDLIILERREKQHEKYKAIQIATAKVVLELPNTNQT